MHKIDRPCFHTTVAPVQEVGKRENLVDFDSFLKEGATLDAQGNVIVSSMK